MLAPRSFRSRDDPVHVRGGERGARARHVLVDRRAPELDAPVVQPEVAALHLDRAQPDGPPLALHHPAAVPEGEHGAVELGRVGRPQHRRGHRHRQLHLPPRPGLGRQAERPLGHAAAGGAQPHVERRPDRPGAAPLEHAVEEQIGPAAPRRAPCTAPATSCRGPRCGPVRPARGEPAARSRSSSTSASGSCGFLRPSTITSSTFRAPGPEPARRHGERRVRVDVAADPAAVEDHRGVAAHAVEADQPAEAARGRRADEGHAVAAHGARIELRESAGVEHARHVGGLPGAIRLGGPPGRRHRDRRALAVRLGLLGRGRLRGCRSGRLDTHLPPAGQRVRGRHGLLGEDARRHPQNRERHRQ